MPFDRFDVAVAAYTYAAEWHGGQWSPEYRLLGTRALRSLRNVPDLRTPAAREEWAGARDNLARYIRAHRAGRSPFRDRT